jgi:hypothetical protein
MRWGKHEVRIDEMRNEYKNFMEESEEEAK